MRQLHDLADEHRAVGVARQARDIAVLAYCVMKAGGSGRQEEILHAAPWPRVQTLLTKAAVDAAAFDHPGWASNNGEALDAVTAFLESLRTIGVFDAMYSSMVRLPTGLAGVRVQTMIETGSTVPEGLAVPNRALHWVSPVLGQTFKSAATVVLSNQIMDLAVSAAINTVERELRAAAAAAVDVGFLSLVTSGVSATNATGSTAATFRADLSAALDRMSLGSDSRVFVVAPTSFVRKLGLMGDGEGAKAFMGLTIRGGDLDGVRVIPTDTLVPTGSPATSTAYVIDASRIAAWAEEMGLARATHAALQMDSVPTNAAIESGSPSTAVPTSLVSLWQANCTAVRATRWWSARRLTDTCVAAISDLA